jgi:hypothetical protein
MITKETLSQRTDGYQEPAGPRKGVRKEVCVLPLAPNGKEGRVGIRAARFPRSSPPASTRTHRGKLSTIIDQIAYGHHVYLETLNSTAR